MRKFGVWSIGLGGSIAAHLAVIPVLSLTIDPKPVEPQPQPQSQIEVQAYQVERSEAKAQQPESEDAAKGDAGGTSLANGEIARSNAKAATLNSQSAQAQSPDAPSVPSIKASAQSANSGEINPTNMSAIAPKPSSAAVIRPSAARVEAAPAPKATKIETTSARIQPTKALAAEPVKLASFVSDTQALTSLKSDPIVLASVANPSETATPAPIKAPNVEAGSIEVAATSPTEPNSQPAPESSDLRAQTVASIAPPAEKGKADFAWASADGAQIDPKSLATIQSFMQPGDLSGATGEVRDGIAGMLATIPCSRLQAVFDPDTGSIDLLGHVPEDGLREPVLAALREQIGEGIPVRDNMRILPRPQCGALSGIASVGLPQSTDQITNPLIVGADAHAREFNYVRNDRLAFDLSAPDYDAYIYVDYFDADGQVIHLVPNEVETLRLNAAESKFEFGTDTPDIPAMNITIGPPYGQEIAVAFAVSEPLFDGIRPLVEPADAYLDWLRERVSSARANDPQFKGEWVYFFVSTAED